MLYFMRLFLVILCFSYEVQSGCEGHNTSPFANFGKKAYPVVVPVIALLRGDPVGAVLSTGLIQGFYLTNRFLEKKINKQRPCGCQGAWPSGHTIMIGGNASFLFYRYGWRFGLPAMIIALLLLADRVGSLAHSWFDVLTTILVYHLITGLCVTHQGTRWRDKWTFLQRFYPFSSTK